MRCPKCGSRDDKVIDSRQSRDSSSIRRRRECLSCEYRFTTYEEIERSDLRVVKRDRSHEPFDRRKLATSIAKAFEKRSTSLLTLEQMVEDIVHELETSGREVSSVDIGAKVLEKLRAIDEVAYLRYASIHQRFQDPDEFVDAVKALGRRVKPNALQRELFPTESIGTEPPPGSVSGPSTAKEIMVAFKEEFPYLRCDSGQLFEFDREWLHAAITRAADEAGYPSWWLTDHVTESIAFYLRLRTDESVVAFSQLSQTVRYVLKVIGYKEIIPHFTPSPPPITIPLIDIAVQAGAAYELAFFDLLEKRIQSLIEAGAENFRVCSLQPCVKHLRGVKVWTRACDGLRTEIVSFVREKLSFAGADRRLQCSIR